MQRLIKFRAYDTKNKKWLDEVPPEEYMLDNDDCWDAPDYGEMCEALSFYPRNPLGSNFNGRIIYQQFTGLLDKNGKEIYEGDIVSTIYGEYQTAEVFFSPQVASWRLLSQKVALPMITIRSSEEGSKLLSVFEEIIGNIFETPELLK